MPNADRITVEAWVRPATQNKPLSMFPVLSRHGVAAGWELRAGNGQASMMITVNRTHYEAAASGLLPIANR